MSDRDAAVVHHDGDRWVYRASGLGNCLGALVRARMGIDGDPHPDWLQERFNEGKQLEDEILDNLTKYGWHMLDRGELEELGFTVDDEGQVEVEVKVPIVGGEGVVVRCHPDGIARHDNYGLSVVEVKATSEGYAKTIEREMPKMYAWQVAVEHAGARKKVDCDTVVFVVARKEFDEGEDGARENVRLKGMSVKHIEPAFSRVDIIKRVQQVEQYVRDNEVPYCEYAQYPCVFWADHDPDDPVWKKGKVVEVPDEDVDDWDYAIDTYEALHNAEKEIKAEKKQASERVKEFFDKWGAKGNKAKSKGRTVGDVVQKRGGGVEYEKLLEDLEAEGVEVDRTRYVQDTFEVRYPKITTTKKKTDDEG